MDTRHPLRYSSSQALHFKFEPAYLYKASIGKIRGFAGEDITFEFPVTALIGPNGSGKSSVLGVAGCAYKPIKPGMFFPKSSIGDESMSGWRIEYEIIDNPNLDGFLLGHLNFASSNLKCNA